MKKASAQVDLSIDNITVSSTDLTFDLYLTATSSSFGLSASDFGLDFDASQFTSPTLSKVNNPAPIWGFLDNGYCTFISTDFTGPQGDVSLVNNVQLPYFNNTSPYIGGSNIIINLNAVNPSSTATYNQSIAIIDNTSLTHRLGRFTLSGYNGADDGTLSGLSWNMGSTLVFEVLNDEPDFSVQAVSINSATVNLPSPPCIDPSNLSAFNITNTSADLAWTENGTATTWNIEYGANGYTQGTGTALNGTSSNPYSLTGLTASTSYDYYVQADCGGGDVSAWAGPYNFTTMAASSQTNIGYDVCPSPFDSDHGPSYNLGQAVVVNQQTTVTAIGICVTSANGVTINMGIYSDNSGAPQNKLAEIMPTALVDGLNEISLTSPVTLNPGTYWIIKNVDINAIIGNDGNVSSTPVWYTTGVGTLPPTLSSGSTYNSQRFAHYLITGSAPSCTDPSALSASNITDTGADLSWTENGTATIWNIEYGVSGYTQGTGTTVTGVTSNPYNLTGLTANTSYDFYVQADCGGGSASTWVGPYSFTTLSSGITNLICADGIFLDSGGATGNYQDGEDLRWNICPNIAGDKVLLQFTEVSIEYGFDTLHIYDGQTVDYWGTRLTPVGGLQDAFASYTSTSPDGCLTAIFGSDASLTQSGWSATISCVIGTPSGFSRLYVDKDATSGANNGSSWADAYLNLQDAIDASSAGNEIWVADGTYYPTVEIDLDGTGGADPREMTFYISKEIIIYGGFSGTETDENQRDPKTNVTILSGDIGIMGDDADNSYHVVVIDGATGNGSIGNSMVLDGFTITKGSADSYSTPHSYGGGILNYANMPSTESSPTIHNCNIDRNHASTGGGGGICNYGNGGTSNPNITNCIIQNNTTTNYPETNGAGIQNFGDGGTASPEIVNCVFYNNTAGKFGSAIYNQSSYGAANPNVYNCIFSDNIADDGTIYNYSDGSGTSNPTFINCTFGAATTSGGFGGDVVFNITYGGDCSPIFNNCIMWSTGSNPVVNTGNGTSAVLNNCIYKDGLEDGVVSYPPGVSGSNNYDSNPLYVDMSNAIGADGMWGTADDGLQVMHCSNAVDNAGATAWATTGLTDDLAGNTRPSGMEDIGAYEYMDGIYFDKVLNMAGTTANATSEKLDANGWTHYYDNECNWLLSIQKNGNNIGTVGDGTFQMEQTTTGSYNSGTATNLSSADYVTHNGDWFVMNRYWNVTPTTQPSSNVSVRFPYHTNDYNDISGSFSIASHQEMVFFKLDNTNDPHSTSASVSDYNEYVNGGAAGMDTWVYTNMGNNIHHAEYMVSSFSGGGGGAGDGSNGGALPVELTYFQAQKAGKTSLLTWETATEENNKGFHIEHSINGTDFERIGWSNGHGNTAETQRYSFIHERPNTGINYYRLVQEDFDGTISYSDVRTVLFDAHYGITVYPNPSRLKGKTNIDFVSAVTQEININVFNSNGQQVLSMNHTINEGNNILSLPHDVLSNGIYIISITHNGGTENIKLSIVE